MHFASDLISRPHTLVCPCMCLISCKHLSVWERNLGRWEGWKRKQDEDYVNRGAPSTSSYFSSPSTSFLEGGCVEMGLHHTQDGEKKKQRKQTPINMTPYLFLYLLPPFLSPSDLFMSHPYLCFISFFLWFSFIFSILYHNQPYC